MIVESTMIAFFGLVFLTLKIPPRISLRALAYPAFLDIGFTVLAYLLHMGTFRGVIVAAGVGLLCSGYISLARIAFGYIHNGKYYPGRWVKFNPTTLR